MLTDFWAAAFNPSTLPRYFHTIAGGVITGSFVVAGICAWYLLKQRHRRFARKALMTSLSVALVVSLAMPLLGHWQALVVADHQPIKMASFEAVYDTRDNVPLWLGGWVTTNADGQPEVKGIAIPSGLSLMLGFSPNHTVTGLASVAPEDRPPLQIVFQSYHLMIALSFVFIGVALLALIMHLLGRLERARWLLWLLIICIPLPIIAMNLGWTSAEVGRQPWIVQGLLRTTDGVSPAVSSGEVWLTLGPLRPDLPDPVRRVDQDLPRASSRKGPDDVVEMLAAEQGRRAGRPPRPAPAGAGR